MAASLVTPSSLRINPKVALGENPSTGFDRFLLSVSLRFCWISPRLGEFWSRCRLSSPGSFMGFLSYSPYSLNQFGQQIFAKDQLNMLVSTGSTGFPLAWFAHTGFVWRRASHLDRFRLSAETGLSPAGTHSTCRQLSINGSWNGGLCFVTGAVTIRLNNQYRTMNQPDMCTTLFDENIRVTYQIMAYRKLSELEATQTVTFYLQNTQHRKRTEGQSVVTIQTEIGMPPAM